jgi:hypothetical protein
MVTEFWFECVGNSGRIGLREMLLGPLIRLVGVSESDFVDRT